MTDSIEEGRQRAIQEYRRIVAAIGSTPTPRVPFAPVLHAFLAETPIIERVRAVGAVIYERRARAGGATDWYYCPDETQLKAIEELMGPGSIVEFYFDRRIKSGLDSPETKAEIVQLLSEIPEKSCVYIGPLAEDGIHIEMEDVSHPDHLDSVANSREIEFSSSRIIFYGKESLQDGDGFNVVELILPDIDGIVRRHPH